MGKLTKRLYLVIIASSVVFYADSNILMRNYPVTGTALDSVALRFEG